MKEGPEKGECDLESILTQEPYPKFVLGERAKVGVREGEEHHHHYWPLEDFGDVERDALLKV